MKWIFFSVSKWLCTTGLHLSISRQRVTDRVSDFFFSQEGSLAESVVPDTCPGNAWWAVIPGVCLGKWMPSWDHLDVRCERKPVVTCAADHLGQVTPEREKMEGLQVEAEAAFILVALWVYVFNVDIFCYVSAFSYKVLEDCLCPSVLKVKLQFGIYSLKIRSSVF